ncbi:hypothetical protein B0H19DRAFT_370935 [Mycena capillaripes]|nr:hypothetical protein B0H19DRAFT_370935 [Mycena capillaripes]
MSVEELQARVDKLDVYIGLQKELLTQLERRKSAVQRQLNAIRDPVARLPLELSSEIFLQCLPLQPKPSARTAPMQLLNVCNSWLAIALSTPALWATIHLYSSWTAIQILKRWLRRAGNYPLSIHLHSLPYYNVDTPLTVVRKYAKQLKHLEIYGKRLYINSLTGRGSFSCLETLTIGALSDHGELNSICTLEFVRFLQLAPNLVECTFVDIRWDLGADPGNVLVLPRLRILKFGELAYNSYATSEDNILEHLTLPALETLLFMFKTISSAEFSLFLQRSAPPLQHFILQRGSQNNLSFAELQEWLRLVPTLTHIELHTDERLPIVDLFSALADSPPNSHFLPCLQSLKLRYEPLPESAYQTVFRALSVRRTQLVRADLRGLYSTASKPGPDICEGLRELAANGMEIYLGDKRQNFLEL